MICERIIGYMTKVRSEFLHTRGDMIGFYVFLNQLTTELELVLFKPRGLVVGLLLGTER